MRSACTDRSGRRDPARAIGYTAPCNQGSSQRPDLGWGTKVLHRDVPRQLSLIRPRLSTRFVTGLSLEEWNDRYRRRLGDVSVD